MARTCTRDQMRAMDRMAIEEFGLPGVVLMENAGRAAADETEALRASGGPVRILAGRGNNGGDGFVIARHLHNRGADVEVLLAGALDDVDPGGDAGVNLRVLLSMGVPVRELATAPDPAPALDGFLAPAEVAVDALLGTGLRGPVRGLSLEAIRALGRFPGPVLAVDIPSGLDCDTGAVLGEAVRARVTVTFGMAKQGFERGEGPACTGRVVVADISLPRAVFERVLGPAAP